MTARLLVIDDDSEILASLATRARRHRHRWAFHSARGGAQGLERLRNDAFDLVITDLSMPNVGGGEVLALARDAHPSMLRFVLSGRADRSMAKDASGAHQVFAKPTDLDDILARADLALEARRPLSEAEVQLVTSGAIVPPSPRIFAALHAALNLADYEPRFVARIVEQDMRLTSRLLQLASSSSLGPRRKVSSVRAAVVALGHTAIQQLVLLEEVMATAPTVRSSNLRDHSFMVGGIAAALEPALGDIFIAGVLHDVGHLLCEEADEAGGRHPLLGSYLAALWGFPKTVVESIRDHHQPLSGDAPTLAAVLAIADRIAFEGEAVLREPDVAVRYGDARIIRWRESVATFFAKSAGSASASRPSQSRDHHAK